MSETPDIKEQFTRMIIASFFTALMIAGAYIRIPLGPVPIVLTNLFVLLAGLVLGPKWGAASAGVYLLIGALGLPVFSAGGGIALFAGPTGGYLISFPVSAFVCGLIAQKGRRPGMSAIFALIAGTLIIYLIGVPWLAWSISISLKKALAIGLAPFLPGDAVKGAAAFTVFSYLKKAKPELVFTLN